MSLRVAATIWAILSKTKWTVYLVLLTRYFKQSSFQFAILWRVSQAVQHNFLMERLAIPYETEKDLKIQLAEKEKKIETLQTQLDVFKQIHKIG